MKSRFTRGSLWFAMLLPGLINAQPGITLGSNIHFFAGDSVRVVLQDIDFTNNGSMSNAPASRFVFAGSSAVNTVNGTALILGDAEMHRSAGRLQLNTPVTVNGKLVFVAGNIDLNGNSITLANDPNGQLINENENSRITGNSGFVRKTAVLTAPVNIDPGHLGLSFTSSQNPGNTIIERYHYSVNGQSIRRVYSVQPANNTGLNATLHFQYLEAELNGLNETQLAAHSSNTGNTWISRGGTNNTVTNTFTLSGINEVGWITLAYSNAALPVVLSAFDIVCTGGQNKLHWQTTAELNSAYFNIENSTDGLSWHSSAQLPAKGTSTAVTDYYFTANTAAYYRLQMVDRDGKFSYSAVKNAACALFQPGVGLYPNPATGNTRLTITNMSGEKIGIELLNAQGQQLWQQSPQLLNGSIQLNIPLQGLAAGTYYLHIKNNQGLQVLKLLKL